MKGTKGSTTEGRSTAGATTQMHMPYEGLVSLIRDAQKIPVERNSLYEAVRSDFTDLVMPKGGTSRMSLPVVHAA